MNELFNIKDNVTVITGGTGVLGRTIAKYLARNGAKVIILGRKENVGNEIIEEIKKEGYHAEFMKTDVMDQELVQKNCDDIIAKYGRIDTLLNAAGGNMPGAVIAPDKNIFDLKVEEFQKVLNLNLTGTVIPTQVFLKPMVKQGKGAIINFSSMAANKLVSALLWNDANSKAGKLDIILTLTMIVTLFKNKGVVFEELLMAPELLAFIRRDITIREAAYGKDKSGKVVTIPDLNTLFADNGLPKVREITRLVGIEKDGEREPLDPWNHNMIVFKPAGKIGFIQPSIEDNELFEEDNVDYMNAGNGIRIAKWRTGESTGQKAGEYTQGSARLIPVITEINGIVCLQVRGFEEPEEAVEGVTFYTKEQFDQKAAAASLVG